MSTKWLCQICDREFKTRGGLTQHANKKHDGKSNVLSPAFKIDTSPASRGWVCPVCGGGNAPWVSHCPCVPAGTRRLQPPPQPQPGTTWPYPYKNPYVSPTGPNTTTWTDTSWRPLNISRERPVA